MNIIYFLGTGGSAATIERDNTSLLIRRKEELILIDCPGSITRKIKMLELDPRKVRSILITHTHPDHIYGLPAFVHSLMLDKLSIKLYGSEETIKFCCKLLDIFQLREEKILCRIDFIKLETQDKFDLSPDLKCDVFKVPHKESSLAFCFDFEPEKKKLLYSGDTPVSPELFKHAAGIDTLIHDCSTPSRFSKIYPFLPTMHTDALSLGRMAQQAGVKRLIPIHFFGELDYSIDEIKNEVRQNYTGELIIPEDLTKITI
jgi:ribonuclease Z